MLTIEPGAPLSIYLDLEKGQLADLAVVSRASLELIAAIRDLAAFADPGVDIKISIQSGEEGSLWLKTIVKLVFDIDVTEGTKVEIKMSTLQAILVGISIYVGGSISNHYTDIALQTFDREILRIQPDGQPITPDEDEPEALPEDIQGRAREIIGGAIRNGVGENHVRKFYAEIKSDPAIKGVGVSFDHETKPAIIIPRSRFAELSRPPEPELDAGKRKRIERLEVLLTQPRLRADQRAWRFAVGGMEFAAKIADQKFVAELLSGKKGVRMVEGVYLNVDMRIEEENSGGTWRITSRTIEHVHSVREAPEQASLLPFFDKDQGGNDDEQDG